MCGGAIISDLIPSSGPLRRLTADYLWAEQGSKQSKKKKADLRHGEAWDSEDDDEFEADFQEFLDESDNKDEEEYSGKKLYGIDTMPISPSAGTRFNPLS